MTSEPASRPRRRPPTIDLTATEIEMEKPAEDAGETAADSERAEAQGASDRRGGGTYAGRMLPPALGALAGAIVVAAIAFGLWSAGIVPSPNSTPPATDHAANAISAQLDRIQSELQSQPPDTALTSRLAALEAQTKTLNDSLAAINRRLDDVAVAAKSAGERADAATAAANRATQDASAASAAANSATQKASASAEAAQGAAQNTVQRRDLDALASRIAALESATKSLSVSTAQKTASADDRAARAAVAAAALRAAVERGAQFKSELAAVKSLGADQNAVAALEPFAAGGVPTDAALAHELAQLIASLQPASAAPPSGAGLLGRLESNAKSLVRITPVNAPPSNDPSSALARLNTDAAHADIAAALSDIARLPPPTKDRAATWVQKVNARNAALAASQKISAAAFAALGNPDTQ
jgi:hypothetical protein